MDITIKLDLPAELEKNVTTLLQALAEYLETSRKPLASSPCNCKIVDVEPEPIAEEPDSKPKKTRKRRTKAEIEAEKSAEQVMADAQAAEHAAEIAQAAKEAGLMDDTEGDPSFVDTLRPEPSPSLDDVRALAMEKAKAGPELREAVITAVKKYVNTGVLLDVPESDYAALMADLEVL